MFARNGTPNAMLRLANDDATGTLDTKLTEANCYVGKYYQLKRDEARARIYFRQLLDRDVLDNLYYLATRWSAPAGPAARERGFEKGTT
jgi:hypothetical protein